MTFASLELTLMFWVFFGVYTTHLVWISTKSSVDIHGSKMMYQEDLVIAKHDHEVAPSSGQSYNCTVHCFLAKHLQN